MAWERPVIHIHCCREAIRLERACYYGGRCDVFYAGERAGPIYECDVNSHYPSVMRDHLYPCRLLGVEQRPSLTDLERWCHDECVCAAVSIDSYDATYPHRDKYGSRMVCGEYTAYLATPELLRACTAGHITTVHIASRYARADLFSRWVERLYALRLAAAAQGRDNVAIVYKLLLDSLYGKLGQHGETWAIDDTVRPLRQWGSWSQRDSSTGHAAVYRAIGGTVERQIREGDWLHAFPAISAHVTSYGREKLRALITTAGVENVYYCDTDSLHTNDAGWQRLIGTGAADGASIGCVRLESVADDAAYRGRKYYRLGSKWTVAGADGPLRGDRQTGFGVDKQARASTIIDLGPVDYVVHESVDLDYSRTRIRGEICADGRVLPERICDGKIRRQASYWTM